MTAAEGVQHCPNCATEYVAGAAACADCGGQLEPGPVADGPPPSPVARQPESTLPEALLTTMPGLQADLLAAALTMEGIACLLECEGIRQMRRPGSESPGALAATLPVAVYVGRMDLGRARDVMESLQRSEIIGDQWQAGEQAEGSLDAAREEGGDAFPRASRITAPLSGDDGPCGDTRPESTTLRLLFLVAATAALVVAGLRC